MNWKILGPFIAGVVIFLLVPMLPMIMALVSGGGADSPVAANVKAAPPLLNVGNLTGTSWQVKTPEIPIAVVITLNAGGQAIASLPASTPPMMVEMAKKNGGVGHLHRHLDRGRGETGRLGDLPRQGKEGLLRHYRR